MLVVFLAPSNSLPEQPELPFADKIVHVFLFSVFAFLLLLARYKHRGTQLFRFKPVITALIFALVFGASIELAQSLMNFGREGSLYDLVADFLGSLTGCLLVLLMKKYPLK